VGCLVGCAVGSRVGAGDGCGLGCAVGRGVNVVGVLDGCEVGCVGSAVGSAGRWSRIIESKQHAWGFACRSSELYLRWASRWVEWWVTLTAYGLVLFVDDTVKVRCTD
jgi:hypothetical protein